MNKKAIAFTASDQTLTKTAGLEQYASNTVSYVEATFTLGTNWTGFDSVRAVWHSQYYDISTVLNAQGKCDVPAEVMYYKSKVYVNLVGITIAGAEISVRLTTYPILAFTVDSEALVEGTETGDITPSQFDQFVAQVHEDAEGAAGSAEAAADAAASSAASAEEAARYMAAEAIADTFSPSATYGVGDYVMHEGSLFRCISPITTAGAWDANEWTQVTVGDEITDLKEDVEENYARIDGYYDEMSVGTAEQLVSSKTTEDTELYTFRTSGGANDIGNRLTDSLVGGTIGWNQLQGTIIGHTYQVGDGSGLNVSVSDGYINVSGTAVGRTVIGVIPGSTGLANHVFFFSATNYNGYKWGRTGFASVQAKSFIHKYMSDFSIGTRIEVLDGETVNIHTRVNVIDLTAMFGPTIADYIYSLEQANAGDGVKWFKKLFPKDYYTYNAGSLQSVNVASHDMVGFNAWDEEWEVGGINSSTGQNQTNASAIRSKNYISVIEGQTYYFKSGSGQLVLLAYDEDKDFIKGAFSGYNTGTRQNNELIIPSGVRYLRFNTAQTAYNHDICINLSWSGYRNGEYEAYDKHSYPYDETVQLRGIPYLTEDGSLQYDGDTYTDDGVVTRKYDIVDLGTLNWEYTTWGGHNQFDAIVPSIKANSGGSTLANALFVGYTNVIPNDFYVNATNKTFCINNTVIRLADTAYTDAATFKTAMSGVYLVYELATPTTEQAQPYTNPQIVNDFGTEEYVDAGVKAGTRDVAIPVGHTTQYMANLRDKLQHLPGLAEEDGDYIVRQTDKEMSLEPIAPYFQQEHPNLVAGSAKQVLSSTYEEDQVPYTFRTSGGSADIGDRVYETVVGGTVGWNQMISVDKIDATHTYNGVTFTKNNDGSIKITGTANADGVIDITTSLTAGQNHKYYIYSGIKDIDFIYDGYTSDGKDEGNGGILYFNRSSNYMSLYAKVINGTTYDETIRPILIDLTAMFGPTIADYVYSLEQATAGAGVAWFRKLFPKDYYAYDPGTLRSVEGVNKHVMTGFNQWDEVAESGYFNVTTGEAVPDETRYRSKNYIPVMPNTSYFLKVSMYSYQNNASTRMYFYDAEKSFIESPGGSATNRIFTTPANARYMRFFVNTELANYDHDICINLSWSGYRNGEYEPYEQHEYALDDSLTLRGIPKLDSSNNLYYDGDIYKADGTVERRYGIVDLGTLYWAYDSQYSVFSAGISGMKPNPYTSVNLVCSKYPTAPVGLSNFTYGIRYNGGTASIIIKDPAYNDADTFKTAMSGVYLVYELATPTTEEATPYTSPQIVNDFGTEEYVYSDEVEVAIPVGHESKYTENLRDKLQHMPSLASGDGVYNVTQSGKDLTLTPDTSPGRLTALEIKVPAPPSANGTYKLQVTVSNGTPTYSWVAN